MPAYFVPVLAFGALGAVSRYLADAYVGARFRSTLPWGTFVINMSGSLALGFLTGIVTFSGAPVAVRAILGTGFCGAYTTFSTVTFETVRLLEEREMCAALTNALASLGVGLLAAGAGLALGAAL